MILPPRPTQVGYEARLRGVPDFDTAEKAVTRFDVIALGDVWGEASADHRPYRPGRNPVGFTF